MITNDTNVESAVASRAQRLVNNIMTLQRKFVMSLSKELERKSISFPQFFLLTQMATHEYMTMTQVAECMDHSTAAATGFVDRLEKSGYLARKSSPDDRRKVCVAITAKGRKTVETHRQKLTLHLEIFISQLSIQEQEIWIGIYEKLLNYCTRK